MMTDANSFCDFQFPATGAPAKRTMPDRLNDIINVKDRGATGDGNSNDGPAIQAAIDYCLSTKADGSAGGTVEFPPGHYKIGAPLQCGSDDSEVAGINLVGCGGHAGNTFIGHHSTWANPNGYADISKGGKKYDSIDSITGLSVNGGIKVTRNAAMVEHCSSSVDMSECVGGSMYCCHRDWGGRPSANQAPHFYPLDACFYLGKACSAISCRAQSLGIGFALCGDGANCIGSSVETCVIAFRIGWGPQGEIPVRGCSVQGAQGERNDISLEIYNGEGCQVTGNTFYIQEGCPPGQLVDLTWVDGIVTARTRDGSPTNIPAGTENVLESYQYTGNGAAYYPPQSAWESTNRSGMLAPVTSSGPSATSFTYPLATNPGDGAATFTWTYPAQFGLRMRRVIDSFIGGNHIRCAASKGEIDLDYNGEAYHRNNVFANNTAFYGWKLPTNTKNLAGWKFIQCFGYPGIVHSIAGLGGIYANIVNSPNAHMKFSDLPDNGVTVPQDGPIEGQEYSIIDGSTAAIGQTVTGGGNGHFLVRYNNAGQWIRIG